MKVCSRCNVEQELKNFSKRNLSKDGKTAWCKDCHKKVHKQKGCSSVAIGQRCI